MNTNLYVKKPNIREVLLKKNDDNSLSLLCCISEMISVIYCITNHSGLREQWFIAHDYEAQDSGRALLCCVSIG